MEEKMNNERKNMIGSSDIAAIMGLSRWKTPLALWAEKTGEIPEENLDEREYVEWGKRLEDVVAQKFSEKNNVKLMAYKKRFVHPVHKFISCELDRIIVGTDEMAEVKTCTAWKAKEWEDDEIPIEYILQVIFALGVSGRKIGHIAVLIGGNTYKQKKIEFDEELYAQMISRACSFMQAVQDKQPPIAMAGDKETLGKLYKGTEGGQLELEEAAIKSIDQYLEEREALKRTIESAEQRIEEIENRIKQEMGENDLAVTEKYKITWKSQISRRLDTDKIKAAGIYDEYCKETVGRVFRVNANKGGKK